MMKDLPKFLIFLLIFFAVLDLVLIGIYFSKTSELPFIFKRESKPGSCLVLEKKYCRKGKPVYEDGELVYVGFKLPSKTPIFSPFSGDFSNTPTFFTKRGEEYITFPGISINEKDETGTPTKKSFSAVYYDFNPSQTAESFKVEKEIVIGYLSEKTLEAYGDYNLLIGFSKVSQEKRMFVPDQEFLKGLFLP